MASSGSGYDLSASTFSPDGRIFQVEYAAKAVDQAGTVIGIKCASGVVLGVAKPVLHKMVVPTTGSYKRIHTVDVHAGVASTGFLPDARVLVSRAMDEAADYYDMYGIRIPPTQLAERLGTYVHYFTLHGALRPFGAASVLAGYHADTKQYSLCMVEPSGVAYSYHGVATGKGKQAAKTELEKLNLHRPDVANPLTVDQAVQHIAKILILLHRENKDNEGKTLEMEMSWICEASNYQHVGVPRNVIAAAKVWAQEQLDEDEGDDEEETPEEGMEE
jgi:20S proteasome subunit alpha 7